MNKQALAEVLEAHAKYLRGESGGRSANLSSANLSSANLGYANLSSANLSSANLGYANLGYANLSSANLSFANLGYANLSSANLSFADLSFADLGSANLRSANLGYANLSSANLRSANLRSAKNAPPHWILRAQIVPQVGAFTAFKKLRGGIVAELEIPGTAGRVGGPIGRKCRASEALVIALHRDRENRAVEPEAASLYDAGFKYRVGEYVRPGTAFDPDSLVECSSGIHFFLSFDEAAEFEL